MNDRIAVVAQKIKEADAILVGAGSGLSSAAGYNHYHYKGTFENQFQDFYETYGFDSLMKGFYHLYSTAEQQWAFYARYIDFMYQAPLGVPYKDLYEIVKNKEYFILTSNVDMQFSKIFPEEKIHYFQGDFRYFQCSQPCHDKIYDNREMIHEMIKQMKNLVIPEELVPRCPVCGWKMVPWVQDDTFFYPSEWEEKNRMYQDFVRKYQDKKLVLLELGVGDMTPAVIELPFWKMTAEWKNTFLVNVNLTETTPPLHLQGKSEYFNVDITEFMRQLRKELRKDESI